MIHAVVCRNETEKEAAVRLFPGHTIQVFGPGNVVKAVHFSSSQLAGCGDCDAGPSAFLVVAQR